MRATYLAVLLLWACGTPFSGTDDEPGSAGGSGGGGGTSSKACMPGRSVACVGPGQCDGFQTCNAKGTGYAPCDCDAEPPGGAPSTGGANSAGSGGTQPLGGEPGVAGGPPMVQGSFIYWTSGTQALIQSIDVGTGEVLDSKELPAPEASVEPAWNMRTFVPLGDGTAKAVWTRAAGVAEVRTLDESLESVASVAYQHEPAGQFFASAYRRLVGGSGRLVWHDIGLATTEVWALDADGANEELVFSYAAHAAGTWLPVHYSTTSSGDGLLLWTGLDNSGQSAGVAEAWVMPSDDAPPGDIQIHYPLDQWARSLTQDPDGSVRLGMGAVGDGAGTVCQLELVQSGAIEVPQVEGWGPGQCKSYAQDGMIFRGYAARW